MNDKIAELSDSIRHVASESLSTQIWMQGRINELFLRTRRLGWASFIGFVGLGAVQYQLWEFDSEVVSLHRRQEKLEHRNKA